MQRLTHSLFKLQSAVRQEWGNWLLNICTNRLKAVLFVMGVYRIFLEWGGEGGHRKLLFFVFLLAQINKVYTLGTENMGTVFKLLCNPVMPLYETFSF